LEKQFDVHIITQNIDDLHERAGSTKVLHLHGEIRKARSTVDENLIYDIDGWELNEGQKCERGSQLRPHIVWFGEMVPELESSARIVATADIFLVIGTSLQVYPASGLIHYAPYEADKYYIDPKAEMLNSDFTIIRKNAGVAVPELIARLTMLKNDSMPN
jgi:NAD-dependent deacetylase